MARDMKKSVRWAFNWAEWLPSEKEFTMAIQCVQLEEKERLSKFVFRKDVRSSLAGRLLMRKFVNEYGSIPYKDIKFSRDENNKPILEGNNAGISFNVSHQGNFTVMAGEVKDVKLGVDIMKLEYVGGKSLSEFFRIMKRTFSDEEWVNIREKKFKAEAEPLANFCRHWSLKESYVKAVGVGITMGLDRIVFKVNSDLELGRVTTDTEVFVDGRKQDWLFEESLIDSNHCVAVALQVNGKAPDYNGAEFKIIDFSSLLQNAVPIYLEDKEYCKKYFEKDEKP